MKNKYYLLIAGENYYPNRGTGDWIGTFETHEEAEAKIKTVKDKNRCLIEWYEIIDLREWIKV